MVTPEDLLARCQSYPHDPGLTACIARALTKPVDERYPDEVRILRIWSDEPPGALAGALRCAISRLTYEHDENVERYKDAYRYVVHLVEDEDMLDAVAQLLQHRV